MKGVLSLVSILGSTTNTLGLSGLYQPCMGLSLLIGNIGEGLVGAGQLRSFRWVQDSFQLPSQRVIHSLTSSKKLNL